MTEADLTQVDVLIIGAGINGAGIARDAAKRGLKTLIVDKGDVCNGTSSWNSRLIHGGLRYLEHAEIGLVRESLREREILLRIAPHLVQPLALTLPIYKHHKRGPLMIRAGMIAYDVLSYDKSLPRHKMFSAAAALEYEPGLKSEGLSGAARYYDAQVTYPERLTLENVLDAVAHGAELRTWTEVTDFQIEAGVVRGVTLKNVRTGEISSVAAKVTVNVAGPWVDDVLRSGSAELSSKRMIGATKGTHIVVDPFPGAPKDALYVEAAQDGRPYFIIPWNDLYLIGTTDVRFDGDPDQVHPSAEEIDYLLKETNIAIPGAGLTTDHVLYAYAGLRPLPYQEGGKEGAITRKHVIHDHAPEFAGLISVIGGKLTTYRSLAEIVVDDVYRKLGKSKVPCTTGKDRLPGAGSGDSSARTAFVQHRPEWLSEQSADHLWRVYGARAGEVMALAVENTALQLVVHEETGAIAAEVVQAVNGEFAQTLHDVLFRRCMIGYARDAGRSAIPKVLRVLQDELGWDDSRLRQNATEVEQFLEQSAVAPIAVAI